MHWFLTINLALTPDALFPQFCNSSPQKSANQSSGYIFNENYPAQETKTSNNNNCALTITKQDNEYLHVRSLDIQIWKTPNDCEQFIRIHSNNELGEASTEIFTGAFSVNISEPTTEVSYADSCIGRYGIKFLLYYEGVWHIISSLVS